MSVRSVSIAHLEPSDSLLYRSYQMVCECICRFVELFWKTVQPITQEGLNEKLQNCRKYFETKDISLIKNPITPQELYLLKTKFKNLKYCDTLRTVRKNILKTIPSGVSIFVSSRLTARLIKNQRFDMAEIFRYIGGRDLEHIGFIIKRGNNLQISHINSKGDGIQQIKDPLFFIHRAVLKINISSLLPEDNRVKAQEIFEKRLLNETLKPRNIPGMSAWAVLPFLLGHKRLWGTSPKAEVKEGEREMCSGFVAKILLISINAAQAINPIPSDEILERMHIVRFFRFFAPYLEEVSFPDNIVNAFPSPTPKIARFLKK